jgi:hypothetical protein
LPRPRTGIALARRTAIGVGVAVVALLVVQAIVDAAGVEPGAAGPMTPFAAGPLIGSTVVAGVGAAVVYAVVGRFTTKPVRNFVAIAVAVFGVMLVPVVVFAPSIGVTPVGQGLLVLYHLLVAVPLTAFVVGAVEL